MANKENHMSRNDTKLRLAMAPLLGLAMPACGDDGPVEVSAGAGTGGGEAEAGPGGDDNETGAEGSESESADGTGGAGGDDGGPPCGFEGMLGGPGPGDYALVELPSEGTPGQHRVFVPAEDCDFPGLYVDDEHGQGAPVLNNSATETGFSVFVYHPQDENGDWREDVENRPAVFFSPANGTLASLVVDDGADEEDHRYRHLMRTLVEAGFVVFAMQPTAESMNSGRRRSALACTMIWARDEWDPGSRLSQYTAIMGHSRGGGAAYLLTEDLVDGDNLPTAVQAPALSAR